MADLSTKKDPLDLRNERPDYVRDVAGKGDVDGVDHSEDAPPSVGTDPETTGDLDAKKPHIELDEAAVKKAEAEGKGYAT